MWLFQCWDHDELTLLFMLRGWLWLAHVNSDFLFMVNLSLFECTVYSTYMYYVVCWKCILRDILHYRCLLSDEWRLCFDSLNLQGVMCNALFFVILYLGKDKCSLPEHNHAAETRQEVTIYSEHCCTGRSVLVANYFNWCQPIDHAYSLQGFFNIRLSCC